jgi:riboflavin synthase
MILPLSLPLVQLVLLSLLSLLILLPSSVNGFISLPSLSSSLSLSQPSLLSTIPMLMFSGIIEEMGEVVDLSSRQDMPMWDGTTGEGVELTVVADTVLQEAYIGCSIAVNGVCLTATSIKDNNKFTVGLASETLRRSNLGKLVKGSKVNLERALKADGRNSGHFVQGHVDCTGKIVDKWKENDSLWVKVKIPDAFMKYIVPKGFICIDGTSLTICDVDTVTNCFTFMLIAHTQQHVIIPSKSINDEVNIEVDVLAKMVDQSLSSFNDRNTALIKSLINRIDELEKVVYKK